MRISFDGCPVRRRPAEAFAMLPPGAAAGPSVRSLLMQVAERQGYAERPSQSMRRLMRHPWSMGLSLQRVCDSGIIVPGPLSVHCMCHVLNCWGGTVHGTNEWSIQLTREARRIAPLEGGERTVGEVVAAAYGHVVYARGEAVDVEHSPARFILALWANVEAAVVTIVSEVEHSRASRRDDAISEAQRVSPIGRKNWTSRDVSDASSEARLLGALRVAPDIFITYAHLQPLRSLSGARATATGDYGVTIRMTPGHVEPILLVARAMSGLQRATPEEFWGSGKCAASKKTLDTVVPPIWLSKPVTMAPPAVFVEIEAVTADCTLPYPGRVQVADGREVDPPHGVPFPNPGAIAAQRWEVQAIGKPTAADLPVRTAWCRLQTVHGGYTGFEGPTMCRICAGYEDLARSDGAVVVWSADAPCRGAGPDKERYGNGVRAKTRVVFPASCAGTETAYVTLVECNVAEAGATTPCTCAHEVSGADNAGRRGGYLRRGLQHTGCGSDGGAHRITVRRGREYPPKSGVVWHSVYRAPVRDGRDREFQKDLAAELELLRRG